MINKFSQYYMKIDFYYDGTIQSLKNRKWENFVKVKYSWSIIQ